MATKRRVVHVKTPKAMRLTASEAEALKPHFQAALANVLSARPEPESIVTDTNVPVTIGNRPRKGRKAAKGAAKKGTKKGARKTGKKK